MMTDGEKKAHREGFLLAARSFFIADFVFRSIERTVNDLESAEYVRIDDRKWEKLIRQAHVVMDREEQKLKEERERFGERK